MILSRTVLVALLSLACLPPSGSSWAADVDATSSSPQRLNVLFIAADDLNHWVGYTGRNPQAKTPNIDRLSQAGVSFTRAYCAAPACNPARAALMSGIRPSTSGCYLNSDPWKKFIAEGKGLSAQFKSAGYFTAGAGKIYHSCSRYEGEWDEYYVSDGTVGKSPRPGNKEEIDSSEKDLDKHEGFLIPVEHDVDDDDISDWQHVDYCISQLGKTHDRPFFLACGLRKPHLPWVVPKKYYERFPLDSIELPPYLESDLSDIPAAGVAFADPDGDHRKIVDSDRWRAAIQSYLATIAYADMNVGRLLDALERSPHRDNTIICFWGDHGWHLGEKQHWRKFTLWEEGARAPLIIVAPKVAKANALCDRPVELLSLYPTLCELTGVPIPEHVESKSIAPLLANPQGEWNEPAITTWGYQNHSVRTSDLAYIRYADGSEELYDRHADPYEWRNLAQSKAHQRQKEEISRRLPATNKEAVAYPEEAALSTTTE